MKRTIALAGNPNSGKTTLFNDLTGSAQYVGNWPGVTVEKKEGRLKGHKDVVIQDLPGIYSLSPYTLEEVVARNYLVKERPDAIINIVDGTNIERNLYLTTQLLELGVPVVVAINMMDLVRKRGDVIELEKLEADLGCQVVEMSALKGEGCVDAAEKALELARAGRASKRPRIFTDGVERALIRIEDAISGRVPAQSLRWYAVKLFERDREVLGELNLEGELAARLEGYITACERELEDDGESLITSQRYAYIDQVVAHAVRKGRNAHGLTGSDRIDRIVTNRILALPIFVFVMWAVYTISIGTVGDRTVGFMHDTLFGEWIVPGVSAGLKAVGCTEWLVSLVAEGIVGGVGAVLGFVPQMLILFLLLSILEDVGYMARVAFIMDRIFRRFGLSGKSFIPMLVASGCGVPGIMASRTIEQDRDRKITIMTTCFIPCGAKMPIVGLIAAALFDNSAWVATSAYFIGVAAVILSGILLKKTRFLAGDPAPFVMELPAYHFPSAGNILRAAWERGWSFIKRAGSVILVASVVVWVLNSLTFEGGIHYIAGDETSILNQIGSMIAVIFEPLGFGSWQAAVATVLGLVAKEEVVGVLGELSSMAEGDLALALVDAGDSDSLAVVGRELFHGSKTAAYSFMVFNLLCAPCFAAMGAIRREMNNGKWTAATIGYMCGFAYIASLIVYQIGGLIAGELHFGVGTIAAVAAISVVFGLLVHRNEDDSGDGKGR